MRNLSEVDPYSVASLPVRPYFDESPLSTATAFVWRDGDQSHLVTNWHVVSGRHFETGALLDNNAAEPNKLLALFTVRGNLAARRSLEIQLWDQNNEPLWWVHPERGHKVDVAVIPLREMPADLELHPINDLQQQPVHYGAGSDVFVIGYPMGVEVFPIWKRGSMASEPNLSFWGVNAPPFLIDTATRPGMSGSPVIRREFNYFDEAVNEMRLGLLGTRFMGVYSGRLAAKDQLDAQIGMVWPTHRLTEIIAGRKTETWAEVRWGHETRS